MGDRTLNTITDFKRAYSYVRYSPFPTSNSRQSLAIKVEREKDFC